MGKAKKFFMYLIFNGSVDPFCFSAVLYVLRVYKQKY